MSDPAHRGELKSGGSSFSENAERAFPGKSSSALARRMLPGNRSHHRPRPRTRTRPRFSLKADEGLHFAHTNNSLAASKLVSEKPPTWPRRHLLGKRNFSSSSEG